MAAAVTATNASARPSAVTVGTNVTPPEDIDELTDVGPVPQEHIDDARLATYSKLPDSLALV